MSDGNVLTFRKRTDVNAELNLKEFIRFCRYDLTASDNNFKWESNRWEGVGDFSKANNKKKIINDKEQFLDEGFVNFSKAYIKYQSNFIRNKLTISSSVTILKIVAKTLRMVNKKTDITMVNIRVLDEVIQTIRHLYTENTAYLYGRILQEIVKFLGENALLRAGIIKWVSPIKQPEQSNYVSSKAEEARLSKLPDETALNAMAEIFSLPDEVLSSRDIFTTSVFALLMCAPSRISEILALPCDCEITEMDSKGVERYGLRFCSLKGYGADIKWIPEVMVPVARKAIERLRTLSQNSRAFAQWVEDNPTEFYRCDRLPDVSNTDKLNPHQVLDALGFSYKNINECESKLKALNFYNKNTIYTLNSLWAMILSNLPEDFPWYDRKKGIKYSNALCSLYYLQLSVKYTAEIYQLQKPTKDFFRRDISEGKKTNSALINIFRRHGYTGPEGKALHLRSHQARHLLNTICQKNGMSELDLAKWSGRALVSQNQVYNHESEDEILRKAEKLDISSIGSQAVMIGPAKPNLPVTPSMINMWEHGAVHVTEFGYCVHDYMMSPCDKFRDCINCNEQVCIKGDEDKLKRLRERHHATGELLARARESMTEEELGADRWVKHHETTLSRLNELIGILSSQEIPDGSQIKLGGESFTQLSRVLKITDKIESSVNNEYLIIKRGVQNGKAS